MNQPTSIHKELQHILGEKGLVPSGQFARYSIDGLLPQAVALPETIEQVSQIMKLACAEGIAVTPLGGGTSAHVGNLPQKLQLVLSLERLNKVINYQPPDLTITVQAGITFSTLAEALAQHRQYLPIDPPLPHRATIGGALASNTAGLLKWRNWNPRDLVIGMKVVQADGTLTKSGGQVVKNVTGYDMARLHIGALGTLGIIVEASFKLVPLPKTQETVVFAFSSLDDCFHATDSILQNFISPLGLAIFDQSAANATGVLSSLNGASHLLAVNLAGGPLATQRQLDDVTTLCQRHNGHRVLLPDSLWQTLVDLSHHSRCVMTTKATLLPSQTREMLAFLESHLQAPTLRLASVCDVPSGVIYSHWLSNEEKFNDLAVLHDSVENARQKAHALGGFLNAEKCPTPLKSMVDVWDAPGDSLAIMKRMKAQYDPKNILNLVRFVGGI